MLARKLKAFKSGFKSLEQGGIWQFSETKKKKASFG
jgi:hypothetical protein